MKEILILFIYLLFCLDLNSSSIGGPTWLTTTRMAIVVSILLLVSIKISKRCPLGDAKSNGSSTYPIGLHLLLPIVSFCVLFILLLVHWFNGMLSDSLFINSALRLLLLGVLYITINSILLTMRIDIPRMTFYGVLFSIFMGLLFLVFSIGISGLDSLKSPHQFRLGYNLLAINNEMYGEAIISLNRKLFGYLLMQPFALLMILKRDLSLKTKSFGIWLAWISLILAGYIGFMSGSRQFLVSFAFCLLVVLIIKGLRKPKAVLVWFGILMISGLFFWDRIVLMAEELYSWRIVGAINSDFYRLELALRAWKLFLKSPLFGYGPNYFVNLTGGYQAHNGFLQILVDWGILGALMLVIAIYYIHCRAWCWVWRLRKAPDSYLFGCVIVGMATAFILPMALAFFLEYSFWSFLALTSSLCTVAIRSKDSG